MGPEAVVCVDECGPLSPLTDLDVDVDLNYDMYGARKTNRLYHAPAAATAVRTRNAGGPRSAVRSPQSVVRGCAVRLLCSFKGRKGKRAKRARSQTSTRCGRHGCLVDSWTAEHCPSLPGCDSTATLSVGRRQPPSMARLRSSTLDARRTLRFALCPAAVSERCILIVWIPWMIGSQNGVFPFSFLFLLSRPCSAIVGWLHSARQDGSALFFFFFFAYFFSCLFFIFICIFNCFFLLCFFWAIGRTSV